MNVNDKLQLIRALEEREVTARRSSGRVAWTSVVIAALVLLVMIGLARRELASLREEARKAEGRAIAAAEEERQINARLSTVKTENRDATGKLLTALASCPNVAAIQEALESLAVADVAAEVPTPTTPTTPGGPVLPEASNRKDAIARLFDQSAAVRVRAYGELLPRYANDSTLVTEILEVARTQPNNANGTYNALVVLSHMNARTLSAHRAEVIAFAQQSQGVGPRVADRARTLIRRVPDRR